MTFGMGVYKASGALVYSTTDVTWNQVDYFLVERSESVAKEFPVLQGREVLVAQVMIDPPPINRKAVAPTVTVSGTTVTVSGGSERAFILVLMR